MSDIGVLSIGVEVDLDALGSALDRARSALSGLPDASVGLDTTDLDAAAAAADAQLDGIEGTADLGMDGTDVESGAAAADSMLDGVEGTALLGVDISDVEAGADAAGALLQGVEGTATLGLDASEVDAGIGQVSGDLDNVGASAGGAAGGVGQLTGMLAGLGAVNLASGWLGDIGEAQQVMAVTTQLVQQTGAASWITADAIAAQSGALQTLTGVSDEAIQGAQNIILSFRGVQNQGTGAAAVFDRATTSALDMSTVMGGDVTGAAMQLGKALEDPVRGMAALSRSGVTFTAEQRTMIEAMVESGDTLGAQTMLLDEVERTMGGAAEAALTPMGELGVATGELSESLGAALMPAMETLLPIMQSGFDMFSSLPGPLQTIVVVGGLLTVGMAAMAAVFGPLIATVAASTLTFGGLASSIGAATLAAAPWLLGIAAIVAIGVILYKNWDTIKAVGEAVWGFITDTIGAAVGFITDHIGTLGRIILAFATGGMSEAVRFIMDHWDGIVDFFKSIPEKIRGFFSGVGDIITAPFRAAFDAVKRLWNSTVGGVGFTIPNWVPGIGGNSFRIPEMAEGGVVQSSGWAMVGEAGPEVLWLGGGATVAPLDSAMGGGGGAPAVVVNASALLGSERDVIDWVRRGLAQAGYRGGA